MEGNEFTTLSSSSNCFTFNSEQTTTMFESTTYYNETLPHRFLIQWSVIQKKKTE